MNAWHYPRTKVCKIAKLEPYSGCSLRGTLSDASIASECVSDDRGEFSQARKSVWYFLLFAWSTQRSVDGGARLCFGKGLVLRLDWPTIRDAVRQGFDSGGLVLWGSNDGALVVKAKGNGSNMLILTRKESERIYLGDDIVLTIVRVGTDKVRIGVEAPSDVRVLRLELSEPDDRSMIDGELDRPRPRVAQQGKDQPRRRAA